MQKLLRNIIPIIKYFILTWKHKWFVFQAGFMFNVPIFRLLIHDWTKFLPSELPYYGRQFFGDKKDPLGFVRCWTHHQNRHEHHWEYWIPRTGSRLYLDNEPIPMSRNAVKEMVADWLGASRAYEGEWPVKKDWKWLNKNLDKIRLHSESREYLNTLLLRIE